MRLFEHPDFEQALLRAAERFGLSEQFVEKDYYITEILRIVAQTLGEHAIFKGGTSLSKGWGLIERFSEDIDLFVNPQSFEPVPGTRKLDKLLKRLTEAVAAHPALTWQPGASHTIGGVGRSDYFAYTTRFPELAGIRSAVLLEPGAHSGDFPTETVQIDSLVARYLAEQSQSDMVEDLEPFAMTLLHYRRTFVEKMFALHGKVIRLQEEGHPLGRDARHYADLYVLAGEEQVRSMLSSPEYELIRIDYDRIGSESFKRSYRRPPGLSFAQSPALFPPDSLSEQIADDYHSQCRLLFSRDAHPSFEDVLSRLRELRPLL